MVNVRVLQRNLSNKLKEDIFLRTVHFTLLPKTEVPPQEEKAL